MPRCAYADQVRAAELRQFYADQLAKSQVSLLWLRIGILCARRKLGLGHTGDVRIAHFYARGSKVRAYYICSTCRGGPGWISKLDY